jgi:molecular chaperone GrpE
MKKEKIEEKDQKIGELTEALQRLQAEFENYKKREDKERKEFVGFANAELIKKVLQILDNFELAFKNTASGEEFVKGMELIYSQLHSTLEDTGLKHIECLNKPFDPEQHEALLTEESEKKPNTIIEELQKGYTLNDKVLRQSKVKVSK